MRVLYADHTGRVSGAQRSLLDLLSGLPEDVSPVVACPPGRLARAIEQLGIPIAVVPELEGSWRIHPWHTTRAIMQLGRAAVRLRAVARRLQSQLIHANSIRAGLAGVLAHRLGGPPVIVHIRDCLPRTAMANRVRQFLTARASLLLANSDYTAANFAQQKASAKIVTVHNPVDPERFSPDHLTREEARRRLGLDGAAPVLGVVGQLAPWKAFDDAIRSLSLIRTAWPSACLLVVGAAVFTSKATRYDNRSYAASLRAQADGLGLDGSVRFLGEREDIPEILRAVDVLLVPSWEEPFGRCVIEAMAMEVPVVATSIGGPAEIITDGEDGILLPPRQPDVWAATINQLVSQPLHREKIGAQGRRAVVSRFGMSAHVSGVVSAYRRVLGELTN